MGLIAKDKHSSSSSDGWGMGFFLVFFPEEHEATTIINNNNNNSSNSSRCKKPTMITAVNTLLKRTNSNHILNKAQSTISICALLIFFTFLLFTLSTFEPNSSIQLIDARRHLSSKYKKYGTNFHALQGLGNLYSRGTKAMADLVICHVSESVSVMELKLFLRLFHRSNLPSKSDLLFLFPATPTTAFRAAIREETQSFLKLVHKFQEMSDGNSSLDSVASFDVTQLIKSSKKEVARAETIWGRKIRSNLSEASETVLTRPSYGSVVSFDVGELDPENSLSGFMDHVPMSLRRWACYPMLLGRVRKYFKHIMLVDIQEVLLLGDPLGRVRSKSPESVQFSTLPIKHGRKNPDKNHQKQVNSAIIMGGGRGIRRLSAAMLPEIVLATTAQHNRKSIVTESVVLNQLVGNEYVLKNINLITSTESVPEVSLLSGLRPGHRLSSLNSLVIRRVNSNIDIDDIIMKHICSFSLDSSVYIDCLSS